jgi:hypothetical protein
MLMKFSYLTSMWMNDVWVFVFIFVYVCFVSLFCVRSSYDPTLLEIVSINFWCSVGIISSHLLCFEILITLINFFTECSKSSLEHFFVMTQQWRLVQTNASFKKTLKSSLFWRCWMDSSWLCDVHEKHGFLGNAFQISRQTSECML